VDPLEALILGLLPGLTEFLVPAMAGWEDPGAAFTAVVQLGIMAAALVYLRRGLWRIATGWLRALRRPRARAGRSTRAWAGT